MVWIIYIITAIVTISLKSSGVLAISWFALITLLAVGPVLFIVFLLGIIIVVTWSS